MANPHPHIMRFFSWCPEMDQYVFCAEQTKTWPSRPTAPLSEAQKAYVRGAILKAVFG